MTWRAGPQPVGRIPHLPVPPGWVELADHLEREHGVDDRTTDRMDSEDARRAHRHLHARQMFKAGHRHTHRDRLP